MSLSDEANIKQLKELFAKRSSIKGRLTKFKKYLDIIVTSKLSKLQVKELEISTQKIRVMSDKFDELQGQIEVINSENLSTEIDERDDIEKNIISLLAIAEETLAKYNHDSNRSESHNASQCHHDHSTHCHSVEFKLPQIQIAKFDGAYFRWLEFRDTYSSLIHRNERIKPIHKFHYLVSYLEGEAARIISNLEISEVNYESAWQLICNRYDNKRQLINHHLNSLLNISMIVRESDRSLRFLADHITKNLRALSSLGQPTEHWDTLIIHMFASKLDNHTITKWEEYRNSLKDYPTLKEFNKFLVDRADVLENLYRGKSDKHKVVQTQSRHIDSTSHNIKSFVSSNQVNVNYRCVVCKGDHRIYDCPSFIAKSITERKAEVSRLHLCVNCLRLGHSVRDCKLGPCRECKRRHNSLLHSPISNDNNTIANTVVLSVNNSIHSNSIGNPVILSTAMIRVTNPYTNRHVQVRALLDCGSQCSFISQSLRDRLALQQCPINTINIIGIGNNLAQRVDQSCIAQLSSSVNDYKVIQSFFVLQQLTSNIPKQSIDTSQLKIPIDIELADPYFNQPAVIDVLIGADLFWDLLGCEQLVLGHNMPKLRSSKLGWLIAGSIPSKAHNNNCYSNVQCNVSFVDNCNDNANIHTQLNKFWEIEEVPERPLQSKMEQACERHFSLNTYRLDSGRFCVRLPLLDTPDCLGDSYTMARKRLLSLEKKFRKFPEFKSEYVRFIREYADLGHLEVCPTFKPFPSYYLCHHAVFKRSSETTKTRVVFDGSARTSSGFCLNDIHMTGPTIQDTLFSILIRARQNKYMLTADIEKMYRQIQVNEQDRNLQLILWRENESDPIKTLRLSTVTYGLASSAYLSTKCLWQLGNDCKDEVISNIIKHDFYVDDLICSSNDVEELLYIQRSVSTILSSGGFNLRKYRSNLPSTFHTELIDNNNVSLSEATNALGINWNPTNDTFHISVEVPTQHQVVTKRIILSTSFKIFDPLGLLSPCIIQPKMLLQSLWLSNRDWDEPVDVDILNSWKKFTNNLHHLSCLQIPRMVLCNSPINVQMHTFSDASQSAYGACVYMRSFNSSGQITIKLLCAKSKVAPLKPMTIPRLELVAALLAARLCKAVNDSLRYKIDHLIHWCDSSVTLSWIQGSTKKLKIFVANRVAEISDLTNCRSWRYVPTGENPADLISRGVSPDLIKDINLWWTGPDFLKQPESSWPHMPALINELDLPELKAHSTLIQEVEVIQMNRFSSFIRLKRTFAYVKRFLYNLRHSKNKVQGILTLNELEDSFLSLCKIAQQNSFNNEYETLLKGKTLSNKSTLLSLTPFLDDNKVIRVGGRLHLSNYDFNKRHPILLHSTHHLTKLYFRYQHLHNMHAGPQLLLACVRETVWPINGRNLARRTVNTCVTCRRLQGKTITPMMGNLPAQRVAADFPFLTTGVDFAGPFYTINRRGRGARVTKTYLCLFVCLRFKCIHLEAVSDLSKDAFILTLRRFISRRGKPAEIFCDNGRNFVAAAREIGNFLAKCQEPVIDYAISEGINFVFSPSYAPHFGGIWEAGVKSAKYHIRRVMGNSHLTFEELSTLFAQVEAILNSRPLCPLSPSPDDYHFLTPGHFLIGRALKDIVSPSLENHKTHQLNRFKRQEQIRQHFWQRWQKEYVAELQQRFKWRTNKNSLRVGDLVLLQEDNVPPLSWRMGRVARLFPGSDNISRVADIKTTRGCFRRPLTRICPLPAAEDNVEDVESGLSTGGKMLTRLP